MVCTNNKIGRTFFKDSMERFILAIFIENTRQHFLLNGPFFIIYQNIKCFFEDLERMADGNLNRILIPIY